MGSLMAGWDSPVLMNPDTVKIERNKSLTKEEIDSFWKVQRKVEVEFGESSGDEDHPMRSPLSPLCPFSKDSPRKGGHDSGWKGAEEKEGKVGSSTPKGSPEDGEKEKKTGDWWTRSNYAFLNEPPEEEDDDDKSESEHKYVAQFHVAKLATSSSI